MNNAFQRRACFATLCLALLGAGAAPASADSPKAPQPARDDFSFAALDADADGSISPVEASFEPLLWKAFGRFDADGDRKLSRAEYATWKKEHLWEVLGPHLLLPPR